MSTTMYGADAEALDAAAAELTAAARELDESAAELASTLGALAWIGRVAIRFTDAWNTRHHTSLRATSSFLTANASKLTDQARQQREASGATTAAGADAVAAATAAASAAVAEAASIFDGAGGPDGEGASNETLDELGQALDALGLAQGSAEAVLEAAAEMDDEELVALLNMLESDGIIDYVSTLGKVVDASTVVLNIVQDYVDPDNRHLPTDERILHALSDAAIRFAIDQGVEKGTEVATTALLSAAGSVVPVLGTAAGAAAGKVIGHILGEVMSTAVNWAVDQVDGKYDVVDTLSDQVLEGYRDAKRVAGFVGDTVGTVVDGAQNAAGAVADTAGAAAGAVSDVASSAISHIPRPGLPW